MADSHTPRSDRSSLPGLAGQGRTAERRALSLIIAVPLVAIALVLFIPTLITFIRAFTNWKPAVLKWEWVGIDNFLYLAGDDVFHQVLINSGVYLLGVPIWVVSALLLMLLVYDRVPKSSLFRTIYLFPLVLSPVLLGLLFASILNPTSGLLNVLLDLVGLDAFALQWIDDPMIVKYSIIGVQLWGSVGLSVLILHAAMSAIPPDLFEAATLDGAGWWAKLRFVVIPGIRPALEAVIVIQTVGVFVSFFGLIAVLTNGGPAYASASLDFDIYRRAFKIRDFGASAAESMVLVALVLLVLVALFAARKALDHIGARRSAAAAAYRAPAGYSKRPLDPTSRSRGARVRWKPKRWSAARILIAVVIAIAFIYPLIYLAGTAIRTPADFNANPVGLPTTFDPQFLIQGWNALGSGRAFLNSIIAVGVGLTVCLALSSLTSFWLYLQQGFRRIATVGILAIAYFLPPAVWVIPLNTLLASIELSNNLIVLGIVYGVSLIPFATLLIATYMARGLTMETLEAARVDGAGLLRQYWSIVLPLSAPALASVLALATAFMWGDLLIGLILLQDPGLYPATLAASQLVGRFTQSLQSGAATALLSFLPLLILFVLTQRLMVRGITAGAGRV